MLIEEEPPAGTPEWAVTFGDMMAILLTFFIMLASMSEIKQGGQFQRLADSLRERFGAEDKQPQSPRPRTRLRSAERLAPGRLSTSKSAPDELHDAAAENAQDEASTGTLAKGMLEFEAGQAELTDEHKRTLQLVAEQFGGLAGAIEVRGRMSQQPAGQAPPSRELRAHYHDNWHLAYTRCHRTMEYLKGLGIDPGRFRLGVSGEPEPVKIAARPLDWRQSERVEVLMLNRRASAAEE